MNAKQRRNLLRKHIKSITLARVQDRLVGGDGYKRFSDMELARDWEWEGKQKDYKLFLESSYVYKGRIHNGTNI